MTKRGAVLLASILLLILITSFLFISVKAEYESNKILAFAWLESRTADKNWPRMPTNIQGYVFSFLVLNSAGSGLDENSIDAALTNLAEMGAKECWPRPKISCNVKDTALAKLMFDAAGESTKYIDDWLLNNTKNYTDIEWYLQITAEEVGHEMTCQLEYDGQQNEIIVNGEGIISQEPGTCFTISNKYWLELKPACIGKTFEIICVNEMFHANFLFKEGEDWYVTKQLISGKRINTNNLYNLFISPPTVQCITQLTSDQCDYEATAWTAYVFAENNQDEDIANFKPYLILEKDSIEDDNKKFLPESFLCYLGLGCSELEKMQGANGLWLAPGSAYNEFYDTALAGIMSSKQAGNWAAAEKTLFKKQTKKGNWEASGRLPKADPLGIRETAMILLALEAEPEKKDNGESCTYHYECDSNCCSNKVCNSSDYCGSDGGDLGDDCTKNNDCKSACCKDKCVATEKCGVAQTCKQKGYDCLDVGKCAEFGGILKDFLCTGNKECCKLDYGDKECEVKYGSCKTSCADEEADVDYKCAGTLKCCKSHGMLMCETELKGRKCSAGQKCVKDGNVIPFIITGDSNYCCPGECVTPSQNCSDLNGIICKTEDGKSCTNGKWLPSIDNQCCEINACKMGVLNCNKLNGEICGEGYDCDGGVFVEAKDTLGQKTCCIQGGMCIAETCAGINGIECIGKELCTGDKTKTKDANNCCVDGKCLESCDDQDGEPCPHPKVCKSGHKIEAGDRTDCCEKNYCVEKKSRLWIWLLILVLISLGLVLFLFMRKKKKKKPKAMMPGMLRRPGIPPTRPAGRGIFRRRKQPPAPVKPTRPGAVPRVPRPPMPPGKPAKSLIKPFKSMPMPKIKSAFPAKPKPIKPTKLKPKEKRKSVLEELEKLSEE